MEYEDFMDSNLCQHIDDNVKERKDKIKKLENEIPTTKIVCNEIMDTWTAQYEKCCHALQEAQAEIEKLQRRLYNIKI